MPRWTGWCVAVIGLGVGAAGSHGASGELPDRYWRSFPKPTRLVMGPSHLQPTLGEQVLAQTLSGLVAYQASLRGEGELLWLGTPDNPSYEEWLRRYVRYQGVTQTEGPKDLWELVGQYHRGGVVKGYILYKADAAGRDLYSGRPVNASVNVATSLCPVLSGVAVEESMASKAEVQGLRLLLDVRDRAETWAYDQYGPRLSKDVVGLQDPRSAIVRDAIVAMNAVTVSGVGPLYDRVLSEAREGSPVLGWGIGMEDEITAPSTRNGLFQTATNWCVNLPVLSSGRTGLDYPVGRFDRLSGSSEVTDKDARYVSFIMSDGDNVQWLMLNFCLGQEAKQYWACPDRGRMPMGWTVPAMDLLQLCPYTLDYLHQTATAKDDMVLLGGGYYYPDLFGAARDGSDILARHARRTGKYMRACGISSLLINAQKWDSPEAMGAYHTYADEMADLGGIFVIQYAPYTGGKGAIRWIRSKGGRSVPVVTARNAIWAGRGNHPNEGTPGRVASLLNRWAESPVTAPEDRFAWVIVHCWSWFRHAGKSSDGRSEEVRQTTAPAADVARGYRPALWCSEGLSKRIKVVTPSALLRHLKEAAGKGSQVTATSQATRPDNAVSLFGSGDRALNDWTVASESVFESHGKVYAKDDRVLLDAGSPATGIRWAGEFPTDNYEVSVEAMRVEGGDFFCGMTFPVEDSHCSLIIGGWSGSVVGLSNINGQHAAQNETTCGMNFENGRWYRLRLRVTSQKIEAWIDGDRKIDLARDGRAFSIWPEQEPMRPFGIATWQTGAALRNLTLRRLPESK